MLTSTETLDSLPDAQVPTLAPALSTRDDVRSPRENETDEVRTPAPDDYSSDAADEPDGKSRSGNWKVDKTRRGLLRRRPVTIFVGVVLVVAVTTGGYIYWDHTAHFESTDDAFITARQFAVAPKVSGYITAVPVTDNQHLASGDVIAHIDERDYRTALEQALAQVSAAAANVQNVEAQITVQQAQVAASQAQIDQTQAALTFAEQQAKRYQNLAQRQAGTVQMAQQTASTLRQQQGALKSAQAALAVAQRQIESLKAQHGSAEANLAQSNAQRDQAQLNLSYTTVTAAQPGRVANLTAAVGQFAQAGTALTMFVPDEIWVAANYKENELAHMRSGQPVTVRIDAYPDRVVRGHVESIQPGSGTAFSLLPAENATGNYVKIVQRVPVKVIMDNPPPDVTLGPGMSVVATVRVKPERSLYERLLGRG